MADKKPHYLGHRDRLRKRLASDAGGLADYELLELVLFLAKPRGDVKPLAKDLLAHFNKDFAEVMNADPARLEEVSGVGESTIAALKTVRAAALRLGQAQVLNRPALSSWQALLEYCRSSMAYSRTERFRILFLDRKNLLIADEEQQKGTVDHTPVYPREVVKRALELEASAIIMVHNHPSGDPTPSKADIAMTREVAATGEKLGISLHDHVVIGKKGEASFKALGLL